MSLGLRQRGLRVLALGGYLLALVLSGIAHEHTHSHPGSSPAEASAHSPKSHCGHHCCRHHHPTPVAKPSAHAHGDEQSCPQELPGHCPDECAACQFLGQCPLPVTFTTLESVAWCRPHVPPLMRTLCTALVGSVHLARGPPA